MTAITREFRLYTNAGLSIPPVIHVNQYDQGETWNFKLYQPNGQQFIPTDAAIVGVKADGNIIANAGTVSGGVVAITETEQMTAAPGKAVFEILFDGDTHGTANFTVLVEPSPTNDGVASESDLSLFQEAIDSISPATINAAVSAWMSAQLTPSQWVIDNSLTVANAAADAKKAGDAIRQNTSNIGNMNNLPTEDNTSLVGAISEVKEDLYSEIERSKYIYDGSGPDADVTEMQRLEWSSLDADDITGLKVIARYGNSTISKTLPDGDELIEYVIDPIRGNVSDLQEDVSDLKSALYNGAYINKSLKAEDWQQGWWGVNTGLYDPNHTNAICLKWSLNEDKSIAEIACDASHKMRIQAWSADQTYVGCWNGTAFVASNPNYFKRSFDMQFFFGAYPNYMFKVVLFANDGTSAVGVADGSNVLLRYSLSNDVNTIENRTASVFDYSNETTWEIGSIFAVNGADYDEVTRGLRTPNANKLLINAESVIISTNPLIETVYAFKYLNGTFIERLGSNANKIVNIESGYQYRFLLLAQSGTVITSENMGEYLADLYVTGNLLGDLIESSSLNEVESNCYCIGTDLIKRNLLCRRFGTGGLKYGQSFLIYNNKFYSTDGGHIAVQSMDFTLEQDVTISVGHGNGFCLGNSNKGYISGWDDNKIYVVNLDTLTIDSVITLPTTGYTTCAVDESNSIAYVFQRETRPNTESKYNVIAYDWANQQTLYSNETTKSFGAMQGCDYFNDRIIVLNGLGTAALPNGYRVYNTKGEILADYVIPDFATIEPEGVFIDKATGVLYMSLVNTLVYTISEV